MATQLDRIEQMLQALCNHLDVHGENAPGTKTVKDLASENGSRHVGIVSRFEHGWGFVESTELGRNFFVHYNDVEGTGLRLLEAGEEVSFEIGPGKDGRPKAVRVRRQRGSQASPVQLQAEMGADQESVSKGTDSSDAQDAGDEEGDMPQPVSSQTVATRSSRGTTARRTRFGAVPRRRPAISW